jgi:hypothetical protein
VGETALETKVFPDSRGARPLEGVFGERRPSRWDVNTAQNCRSQYRE